MRDSASRRDFGEAVMFAGEGLSAISTIDYDWCYGPLQPPPAARAAAVAIENFVAQVDEVGGQGAAEELIGDEGLVIPLGCIARVAAAQ